MSGWRAKIGIISVVSDSFEAYVHGNLPLGVSVISTKLPRNYETADVVSAFRVFENYNADVILYTGKENWNEIESILFDRRVNPNGKIITRSDVVKDVFAGKDECIFYITPYERENNLSDDALLNELADVTKAEIPLAGIEDEDLMLDDATDYWKYHRIKDAIAKGQTAGFDRIYVEDIEIGISEMIGQIEGFSKKPVLSTQRILFDAALTAANIGQKGGA